MLEKELKKLINEAEEENRKIAPSIFENEDVKKGILLQLFGGNRKDFSKFGPGKTSCCAATRGPASPSCSSTSST